MIIGIIGKCHLERLKPIIKELVEGFNQGFVKRVSSRSYHQGFHQKLYKRFHQELCQGFYYEFHQGFYQGYQIVTRGSSESCLISVITGTVCK